MSYTEQGSLCWPSMYRELASEPNARGVRQPDSERSPRTYVMKRTLVANFSFAAPEGGFFLAKMSRCCVLNCCVD